MTQSPMKAPPNFGFWRTYLLGRFSGGIKTFPHVGGEVKTPVCWAPLCLVVLSSSHVTHWLTLNYSVLCLFVWCTWCDGKKAWIPWSRMMRWWDDECVDDGNVSPVLQDCNVFVFLVRTRTDVGLGFKPCNGLYFLVVISLLWLVLLDLKCR